MALGFATTGVFLVRLYALHQNMSFIISGMKIKSGRTGNLNRFYKTLEERGTSAMQILDPLQLFF